jgi:hypothetical protein
MPESSEPPSDPGFEERERITANLRFRSLPAAQRSVLGLFAMVPPKWRGPIALFVVAVLGALSARAVPALVEWLRAPTVKHP